jgi:hypothetical protein
MFVSQLVSQSDDRRQALDLVLFFTKKGCNRQIEIMFTT